MDPVSQCLFGASLSGSFSKKKNISTALLCGTVGGIFPDIDVFIKSQNDPLLFIEYHRHFTHSLVFVPFGGLLVSLFLYIFLKKKLSFKYIFLFSTIGLLSHGILDSCTSYGTNLFWPLSDHRVAWNIISIIDPIYTFTLLFFLILCIVFKSLLNIRLGLFFSFFYLFLGFQKHQHIKSYIYNIAESRGHNIERLLLNPTIGNNILWRSVYQSEDNYYIDAVYFPLFSEPAFKEGVKIKVINKETVFPELYENSVQREDIKRFSYFSQDYIYLHPHFEFVIGDLRYGTLPHDYNSLWGIEINIKNPEKHVNFKKLRNFEDRHYEEFWLTLKGQFKNYEYKKIYYEKTFSGPMGMGLAKSYFIGNKKICIYNTVRGQEKITLKKKNLSCPLNLNKNF